MGILRKSELELNYGRGIVLRTAYGDVYCLGGALRRFGV